MPAAVAMAQPPGEEAERMEEIRRELGKGWGERNWVGSRRKTQDAVIGNRMD